MKMKSPVLKSDETKENELKKKINLIHGRGDEKKSEHLSVPLWSSLASTPATQDSLLMYHSTSARRMRPIPVTAPSIHNT